MRSTSLPIGALLWWGCLLFAVVALGVGAVGVSSVRGTAATAQHLADDELATLEVTTQLGHSSKNLQLGLQALALSPDRGRRVQLAGTIYNELMPATESALVELERVHGADHPTARAELTLLGQRWAGVRSLINSSRRPAGQPVDSAVADELADAFAPFDAQIEELAAGEQEDAAVDEAVAGRRQRRAESVIAGAVAAALLAIGGFGWFARWRFRRAAEPAHKQAQFSGALQLAESEEEAHGLLRRHLQRMVRGSEVTVLNRNNSADRLQAVTPLAPDSALRAGLEHAEPRSCLAVRSGAAHEEDHQGLLACAVCGGGAARSLCTPLTVGGEVIGAVLVGQVAAFDAATRERVRDSVGQAAPVLANLRNLALAEQRAATDSLTGLPNKRMVGDALKRLLAAATRSSTPLTLLMLDLDHFRAINERFGHPVGDQALANVGAALRSTLREGDFAGRNGGEEFMIALPDTDLEGGVVAAEKIRAAVAQVTMPGVDLKVTASIGVAAYPQHATSADRLERSADSALYVAKRSGRNRVEVATRPVERTVPDDARELASDGREPALVVAPSRGTSS
ncbi:diguanylate cyclase (GGDEF) domain-containing protein [Friedmanniella luteola]|uniref:Diguanylate cyclase (GGDEF) domain-containing protein n=1 Tax=Friedmanniella luteola TaxID=546871 RepID=A0A1H1Z6C3_9ACTN|nr:GGDEF domain-containing protein [Friedmanniella luteola]SDT29248.1 diguanylate cyclase (GGDEF) domain-containing protein [Friedmanniella luteola]